VVGLLERRYTVRAQLSVSSDHDGLNLG